MKRSRLNLLVDLVAVVLLMAMIATGFILWLPLPPGTETTKSLWGLSRYSWGTVHAWISLGLLGILFFHVALHWKWLVSTIARRLGRPQPSPGRVAADGLLATIVLTGVAVLFAWLTLANVRQLEITLPQGGRLQIGPQSKTTQESDPSSRPDMRDPVNSSLEGQATATSDEPADANQRRFLNDVWPLFQQRCLRCHGPQRAAGGFRVDRQADFYRADQRRPLIEQSDASASGLIDIVTGLRRLPRPGSHILDDNAVELLRSWINDGAAWVATPAAKN